MDDISAWLSTLPGGWVEGCPAGIVATAREAYGSPGRFYRLLALPAIFSTPEGVARWEAPARENIAREVAALTR